MRISICVVAVLAGTIVLTGCMGRTSDESMTPFVGTWQLVRNQLEMPGASPKVMSTRENPGKFAPIYEPSASQVKITSDGLLRMGGPQLWSNPETDIKYRVEVTSGGKAIRQQNGVRWESRGQELAKLIPGSSVVEYFGRVP